MSSAINITTVSVISMTLTLDPLSRSVDGDGTRWSRLRVADVDAAAI